MLSHNVDGHHIVHSVQEMDSNNDTIVQFSNERFQFLADPVPEFILLVGPFLTVKWCVLLIDSLWNFAANVVLQPTESNQGVEGDFERSYSAFLRESC